MMLTPSFKKIIKKYLESTDSTRHFNMKKFFKLFLDYNIKADISRTYINHQLIVKQLKERCITFDEAILHLYSCWSLVQTTNCLKRRLHKKILAIVAPTGFEGILPRKNKESLIIKYKELSSEIEEVNSFYITELAGHEATECPNWMGREPEHVRLDTFNLFSKVYTPPLEIESDDALLLHYTLFLYVTWGARFHRQLGVPIDVIRKNNQLMADLELEILKSIEY